MTATYKALQTPDGTKLIVIRDYVQSLNGYEREIAGRYLAGEDVRTIADAHNVAVGTIRADLRRALMPLREL